MLEQTLSSLAAQTYPAELTEIVVTDDCSSDDTAAFIDSVEMSQSLVVEHHTVNRGRSAARNTAIRKASGDLVVFVDDDMRCDPDLLSAHAAFHENHVSEAAIGNAVTAPELGRSTAYTYLDRMGVHKLAPGALAPARYFVTNNASVERRRLVDAGLFDESFESYGFEDTELGYRLESTGVRFRYCSQAIAYHVHPQTLGDVLGKRREAVRPMLRVLAGHPERIGDLSLTALMPPGRTDGPALRARKLAVAALTVRPVALAVEGLARSFHMGRLSLPVMTYLIAATYRRELASAALSDCMP